MSIDKKATFEELGGRDLLIKINKIFYDKIYKEPWIKQYFEHIPQKHIEDQQTDFMQSAMGGGKIYIGKAPPQAHQHMYISDELFELRQKLLLEAFEETKASQEFIDRWLKIDNAFFDRIVKTSLDECIPRYKTDTILNFTKPS